MWDDPIRDPWALSAVLLVGLALFGPAAFMMGRQMFGRRKQETMSEQQRTTPTEPDQRDPQTIERDRAMADMPDDGAATEAFGVQRDDEPPTLVQRPAWAIDKEAERRWAAEGVPAVVAENRPGFLYQSSAAPQPIISQTRTDCEHCGGRGFMPGINDLLTESVALLGDEGDEVIRMFYSSLLRAHPQLMTLFPGDPTQGDFGSDHKGAVQRDRLLKALTALAGLYDPSSPAKMDHLDQALASFGRSHAAFTRQDGTIKGATLEEYAAVKEALFSTLVAAAGAQWKPEYTEAWSQAYDYATAVMLAEQFRSGFSAPRFPRPGR